jgi:hypothetical protein
MPTVTVSYSQYVPIAVISQLASKLYTVHGTNSKVHYRVHSILPLHPVPCQMNPIDVSAATCVTRYETIFHC